MIQFDNILEIRRNAFEAATRMIVAYSGHPEMSEELEEIAAEHTAFEIAFDVLKDLEDEHDGAVSAFVEAFGMDLNDADDYDTCAAAFQEVYIGQQSVRDYVEDLLDSTGELNSLGHLAQYFDYDAYARDLVLGGDVTENEGFLFHSNW
jgi:antirestriction protein